MEAMHYTEVFETAYIVDDGKTRWDPPSPDKAGHIIALVVDGDGGLIIYRHKHDADPIEILKAVQALRPVEARRFKLYDVQAIPPPGGGGRTLPG